MTHGFDKADLFFYEGPSMRPTFRTGDRLRLVPCQNCKIRTGDVIIFESPEEKRRVVHRVVSVSAQGIRTRGDHNRIVDPYLLHPEQIIGRVVSCRRGKRNFKPLNGLMGLCYHSLVILWYSFIRTVVFIFRPLYRFLRYTRLLAKIFPIHFKTHVISFEKKGVKEYQLLWCNHIIGRRSAGLPWQVHRFFLLWIDEKSLP